MAVVLVLVMALMLRAPGGEAAAQTLTDVPPPSPPATGTLPPLAGALAPLTGALTPPTPPPPPPAVQPETAPPVASGPCTGAPASGKAILMNLTSQQLMACQDGAEVLDTPITTGRPELPTPTGSYSVLRKISPWVMRSPWPRGSRYWYAPSKVEFTLWFLDPGYAIHDAPWRDAYGAGTEAQGSHGCVNVPRPAMDHLYGWADVGVPVLISP